MMNITKELIDTYMLIIDYEEQKLQSLKLQKEEKLMM